ncbi:P-loop containing nucleoside triphosphate hydrolase protein [Calocera cornea HHB12733]|uniref:DNA 3'-5' helicase n=1 Tax=Calocera cornea HHB12733 TaxID=1353952 RepID=A0A165CZI9_9BASI|nr:P-loop containing nucleoside triphosphate hydrolase protein [Calocera cornea HHB12733]
MLTRSRLIYRSQPTLFITPCARPVHSYHSLYTASNMADAPGVIDYLSSLNDAQRRAVEHPPNSALQILAGPGSGKTRVLTSRVAHFILHHRILPQHICCVTFTNKAANEMRERLVKLVGPENTGRLVMGTFHALCAKYLRKYGQVIGLESNFSIVDTDAGKRLISNVLRNMQPQMMAANFQIKESEALSRISSLKAKGIDPESARMTGLATTDRWKDRWKVLMADIYAGYQDELKNSNSLDFDDLLVYGVSLFKAAPGILNSIKHILVDEFQDTNTMQYQLMMNFARASDAVSVVGDPDQSIYGWRAADVGNLDKMCKEFADTTQILLEENYRSTASILACSLAIVSQDDNRIDKGLRTSHPKGTLPVNRSFPDDRTESEFIATEVKRLIAYSGGMLTYNDVAVLLRYNALSRQVELALQKQGIPSRVLAGQKFFDRLEVKDLLAYLQLVDNPKYVPGFIRVINVPKRSIGDRSVEEIMKRAKQKGVSPMEVVEKIADGRWPDIKPSIKSKLREFVNVIQTLRKLACQKTPVADLLERLLELTKYEAYLTRTHQDAEMRWENVRELINSASQVDSEKAVAFGSPDLGSEKAVKDEVLDFGLDYYGEGSGHVAVSGIHESVADEEEDLLDEFDMRTIMAETPLRRFLESSMLATDTEVEDSDSREKVTIATCHAAKGLEWPVVFVPACEDGVFPFYRSDDKDEERRLLYVACTRAQVFLYLTHTQKRMVQGKSKEAEHSEYLTNAIKSNRNLFTAGQPTITYEDCKTISKIVNRMLPDRPVVEAKVAEYQMHPDRQRKPSMDGFSRDENRSPALDFTTGFGLALGKTWPLQSSSHLAGKPFKMPSMHTAAPLQSLPTNRPDNGMQGVASFQSYQASATSYPSYSSGFTSGYSGASFKTTGQFAPTASVSTIKVEPGLQAPTSGIVLAGGKKRLGMGFARPVAAKKFKLEH